MNFYKAERDLIGEKSLASIFHDILRGTQVYAIRTSATQHFVGYFTIKKIPQWIEHHNVEPEDYLRLINRLWPLKSPGYTLKKKIKTLNLVEFNNLKEAKFIQYSKNKMGEVKVRSGATYTDVVITGEPDEGDIGILIKPIIGSLIFYKAL